MNLDYPVTVRPTTFHIQWKLDPKCYTLVALKMEEEVQGRNLGRLEKLEKTGKWIYKKPQERNVILQKPTFLTVRQMQDSHRTVR